MPIYEYRCQTCNHELEAIQKMSDAPLQDCPACGEAALVKLVSAAGFRLKGSGWYETDFKNRSKAPAEGTTAEKKDAGEKKEDKPAAGGCGAPACGSNGCAAAGDSA